MENWPIESKSGPVKSVDVASLPEEVSVPKETTEELIYAVLSGLLVELKVISSLLNEGLGTNEDLDTLRGDEE